MVMGERGAPSGVLWARGPVGKVEEAIVAMTAAMTVATPVMMTGAPARAPARGSARGPA